MLYDHVVTIETSFPDQIQTLFSQGYINLDTFESDEIVTDPHTKYIIKYQNSSALAMLASDKQTLHLIKEPTAWGVKPRNKEQAFLLHTLQDVNIPLQIVLGHAGTGKTLVTYAAATKMVMETGQYKNIVLTKPTYEVGGGPGLGAVPGDIDEKFAPFLINFEHIANELKLPQFFQFKDKISYVPIQRMRGASFINTIVIADEVQSLDMHEMRTLCTRIGKGSKLVLMGDLNQIDRKIKAEQTGLYRLATSERIRASHLCALSELIKNERSELSALLDEVLA